MMKFEDIRVGDLLLPKYSSWTAPFFVLEIERARRGIDGIFLLKDSVSRRITYSFLFISENYVLDKRMQINS